MAWALAIIWLKHVKTDYAIVLNPDVIFEDDSFQHMINESKNLESFSILAPISKDLNYPNYKINSDSIKFNENSPFKVSSVDVMQCF